MTFYFIWSREQVQSVYGQPTSNNRLTCESFSQQKFLFNFLLLTQRTRRVDQTAKGGLEMTKMYDLIRTMAKMEFT